MKRIAFILTIMAVVAATFFGCCPCRHLTTGTRDSVRVETNIRTERIIDTAFIEVPVEVLRQTVRDTTSRLETSFAVSEARINTDGSLSHSLENKPQNWPVPFEKKIVYRDSIVYRDRKIKNIVEVPRPLTWWQQTQIRGFYMLLVLLLVIFRKQIAQLVKKII